MLCKIRGKSHELWLGAPVRRSLCRASRLMGRSRIGRAQNQNFPTHPHYSLTLSTTISKFCLLTWLPLMLKPSQRIPLCSVLDTSLNVEPTIVKPSVVLRKRFSTNTYGKLVLFLQKSPSISGNLREFTGECNLGILNSSSLLIMVEPSVLLMLSLLLSVVLVIYVCITKK